jgi:hypothetical protein
LAIAKSLSFPEDENLKKYSDDNPVLLSQKYNILRYCYFLDSEHPGMILFFSEEFDRRNAGRLMDVIWYNIFCKYCYKSIFKAFQLLLNIPKTLNIPPQNLLFQKTPQMPFIIRKRHRMIGKIH